MSPSGALDRCLHGIKKAGIICLLVTARLLRGLVGDDAFDDVRVAVLVDEELPDAAGPGSGVGDELLQAFDAPAVNAVTLLSGPVATSIISP